MHTKGRVHTALDDIGRYVLRVVPWCWYVPTCEQRARVTTKGETMTTNVFSEGNYRGALDSFDLNLGAFAVQVISLCDDLNDAAEQEEGPTRQERIESFLTNGEPDERENAKNLIEAMALVKSFEQALGLHATGGDYRAKQTQLRAALNTLTSMSLITVEQARDFAVTVPRVNGTEFKIAGEARARKAKAE